MFLEKTVLLARINSAIERNNCLKRVDDHDHPGESDETQLLPGTEQSALEAFVDDTIRKLERRLEAVEEQNDRLLYFIHYLYENLPVQNLVETGGINLSNTQPAGSLNKIHSSLKAQPTLTPREVEVLNLLKKGLCAKEIAKILFICETTVITHKRNLKEKFQARNTVELISKTIHIISPG